jgi:hypothetical protein
MLDNEVGKRMLEHLLGTIRDISDKEYQRRVWIRGIGPEVDDFDETVCCFFDMGDPVLRHYKKLEITESQYRMINKFRDQFEKFRKFRSHHHLIPIEFIDTPEWDEVVSMAKEVLKAFNYKHDKKSQ